MKDSNHLSDKSVTVLTLIANGRSYSQIVDAHPEFTYLDIFGAALEALRLNEAMSSRVEQDPSAYQERLANIKTRYPRAYERWTAAEDAKLCAMYSDDKSVSDLSSHFQRQPSAIRSRLARLGLISADQADEEERA